MAAFRGSAVPGSGRTPKAETSSNRVVVPFEENRHLTKLLGEYDSHLALIEDRLGIEAHAHGNVVILSGSEAACDIARDVLEKLYVRVSEGQQIVAGDFDGLIRHVRDGRQYNHRNDQTQNDSFHCYDLPSALFIIEGITDALRVISGAPLLTPFTAHTTEFLGTLRANLIAR